jgi:hypothetical protein
MNTNEPVAWMELYYGEPNNISWTDVELRNSGEVYKTIPLYAHPAKTLTDEEIKQIFQEQTGFFFDDNPADDLALMDFARAVLKKAGE